MSADFETWAMRVVVIGLGGLVLKLVHVLWKAQQDRQKAQEDREIERQKAQEQRGREFYDTLDEQRQVADASLKEFRKEFMEHLDRLRSSQETALGHLNQTMAEVARTAGEIRARMAEKYASKDELAALERRINERFANCKETCPPGCGN